jgi:Fe-S-cluster containining protein
MGGTVKIGFDMEVGQERIRVEGTVPEAPVPARRMLPFFHGIADSLVEVAVREAARDGNTVTCRAGCGACCRQLVPVTRTDARALRTLVDELPEPRRAEIRARFERALSHLETAGLLDAAVHVDSLPPDDRQALARRYLAQGIACPFLEDESCSIHAQRPVVCREYLVTSPAEHCVTGAPEHVRNVPLATHLSAGMTRLESGEGGGNVMPLVAALRWAEDNEAEPEPQPAVEWINTVFRALAG